MAEREEDLPHAVIVGAGFAGAAAFRELADAGVPVTVIDQHPYSTFRPLLYQVATGGVNPGDVTYPLRNLSARNHARYRRAQVTGLDQEKRQVLVDEGAPIGYDYLVIAIGSTTNYFGVPGAAEHTMSLYTREDALGVRDAVFGRLEQIAAHSATGTGGFTTVVVGGGATGVEMAGAMAELRRAMLTPTFPELNPADINVILVEMTDAILPPFSKKLQNYALRQLAQRGVDIRLNSTIAEVDNHQVRLKDGSTIAADLVIWAAGVAGRSTAADWNLPIGKGGRIVIGDDLGVSDHGRIFAIGDAAVNPDQPTPQLAAPAMQMGKHAAHQILRRSQGEATVPFRYHDKGMLATIGNGAAVVQLPRGTKITGPLAWVAWVGLHLWYLLGGRNRVTTLINLSYRYLLWPRQTAVIIGDVPQSAGDRNSSEGDS